MTRNRLAPLAVALGAAACTSNPYVIGAVCPPFDAGAVADPRCGGSGSGTTFGVDFATSGASQLGALALPSGDVAPVWRLLGQGASATSWTADVGGSLGVMSGAQASDAAPFTDGTRAAQLAAMPTYLAADATTGAVGADDFALEVVLRGAAGASLLDKRAGATGWSLRETAAGQLVLDLDDGVAPVVEVSSGTLTANAWYHCLFWVGRATVARADCDGSMGTPVTMPALGALDSSTEIVAGGGAAIEVAEVALFRVPAGGLGSPSAWSGLGGRRFAQLTGTSPRIAHGSATPTPGLRGSEAYLDLQPATGPRELFLVGADWPRVVCRYDTLGARPCGYLSEPVRARHVPVAPSAWQANELLVTDDATSFTGAPQVRFAALSATTANAVHSLSFTGAFGAARQILSFFARASAAAARVEVSVGAAGVAAFDVGGGSVSSAPAAVRATIEPWGGGIFRCSYALDAAAGPSTYTIGVLDATGAEMYAGSGTATVEIAGLQLDTGLAVAGSLLGADPQPADHLTFTADDGNLPAGTATYESLSVLLPAGPRVTDQAIININHEGSFADQVQLFVRGDAGLVKFWDLSGGATHWTFDGSVSVIDGARHTVVAGWDAASARLAIDGKTVMQQALIANATPFGLDRIDVGFSETSAGALEGLVGGLQIGAM